MLPTALTTAFRARARQVLGENREILLIGIGDLGGLQSRFVLKPILP